VVMDKSGLLDEACASNASAADYVSPGIDLVGTLDRFNDAKRHEEADRVAHISMRKV